MGDRRNTNAVDRKISFILIVITLLIVALAYVGFLQLRANSRAGEINELRNLSEVSSLIVSEKSSGDGVDPVLEKSCYKDIHPQSGYCGVTITSKKPVATVEEARGVIGAMHEKLATSKHVEKLQEVNGIYPDSSLSLQEIISTSSHKIDKGGVEKFQLANVESSYCNVRYAVVALNNDNTDAAVRTQVECSKETRDYYDSSEW
ncbi:hypothetical protein JNJ66_00190 [Candidatus Saccharibacteria bacterium]|nr:hypothetical protein [Candidatus Saccharibacteria bacterium]